MRKYRKKCKMHPLWPSSRRGVVPSVGTTVGTTVGSPCSQSLGRSLRKFSWTDCNLSRKVLSLEHSAVSDQEEALQTWFSLPVRCAQEKCREQGRDLCLAFIDLTKAFDSVNREALWACPARLECQLKFVNITWQLHEGMKGCVL